MRNAKSMNSARTSSAIPSGRAQPEAGYGTSTTAVLRLSRHPARPPRPV
jgi:hypothetical protein